MIAMNDKEGLGEENDISISLRQRAASDLMPYIAPKLRSSQVEVTGSQENQRLIMQLSPELAGKLLGDSTSIRIVSAMSYSSRSICISRQIIHVS